MNLPIKTVTLVLFLILLPLTGIQVINGQNKPFKVVLDAGHGGKDPGNRGNGYYEKDIALQIVLKLGKLLESNFKFNVIYTRKTDVFIGLSERAAIANKHDADLFVSIHCNAHNSNAHGTETFVLGLHKSKENFEIAKKENQVIFLEDNYEEIYAGFDPNSPESIIGFTLLQEDYLDQSIEVASYMQDNFTKQLKRNNRSVKQAGFLVLLKTYMPSVLIEVGFLTNKDEGAYLNSNKGQEEMAQAIHKAILNYYNSIYASYSSTTIDQPNEDNKKNIEESEIYDGVSFKVQIAASSKKLETKPSNFKGLNDLSRDKEDKLYRYYYGSTSDYLHVKRLQKEAISKGYTTAFIVAFKQGKKVKLTEVINN